MTAPITLPNTLENLEAEYFMCLSAPVQNLPRLAVLYDEIERLKADRKLREGDLPCAS